jgi:6,7-dimethyl-8-ribityllumazine synthase
MMRVGVVCGAYHREHVERMFEVVKSRAVDLGVDLVDVAWVPGAFEVPLACKRMLEAGLDGVVALGIIERGETQHGRVIGGSVTSALLTLQLHHDRPIGLGIIGPGVTPEQVEPRLVPHASAALDAVVAMHR